MSRVRLQRAMFGSHELLTEGLHLLHATYLLEAATEVGAVLSSICEGFCCPPRNLLLVHDAAWHSTGAGDGYSGCCLAQCVLLALDSNLP